MATVAGEPAPVYEHQLMFEHADGATPFLNLVLVADE